MTHVESRKTWRRKPNLRALRVNQPSGSATKSSPPTHGGSARRGRALRPRRHVASSAVADGRALNLSGLGIRLRGPCRASTASAVCVQWLDHLDAALLPSKTEAFPCEYGRVAVRTRQLPVCIRLPGHAHTAALPYEYGNFPYAYGCPAIRIRQPSRMPTATSPCEHGDLAVCAWQRCRVNTASLPYAYGYAAVCVWQACRTMI
jgi:hypothetical protein